MKNEARPNNRIESCKKGLLFSYVPCSHNYVSSEVTPHNGNNHFAGGILFRAACTFRQGVYRDCLGVGCSACTYSAEKGKAIQTVLLLEPPL